MSDLMETADRASRLASDVAYYHSLEASALETAAAAAAADPSLQQDLAAQSLEAREAAASAAPHSATGQFAYARALLGAGQVENAVERYELAITMSPRYWAAWLEMASAYAIAGRTADGVAARVVSMPSVDAFDAQDADYRESVLPAAVTARVAIEAGVTEGWWRHVGQQGRVIGLDRFGESAPAGELFEHFGFTMDNVVAVAKDVLN